MDKQTKQHEQVIDLDAFEDVSLYQLIPSGKGFGQALLKCHVDAVLNGRAKLSSILITGKEGLYTHSRAFLKALGIESINEILASLLHFAFELQLFFCEEYHDGYIVENIEQMPYQNVSFFVHLLKKKQLKPYSYVEKKYELFDVPGVVVLTSQDIKKVPKVILNNVNHIVELEKYNKAQLELIILQRLKYAKIDYENESVLKEIVRNGQNNLEKSIRFMKTCVAIMQADGRDKLLKEDVVKAARLNLLPVVGDDFEDTIPF